MILIGTTRHDGAPRVSPCEFFFWESDLYLGMMWQSRKALDLLRDPRCLVHSAVIDKNDPAGEFKLRAHAVEVRDAPTIERYCRALKDATGWCPEGPFHLFAIDIERATLIRYMENGDQVVREWRPGAPGSQRLRRWTGSGCVD